MEFETAGTHTGASEPGTYVPILELASGGMGTVSVCVRRSGAFERLYAIKRLHPHLRNDPSMRSMFLDEARMSGLLRHSNVVPVLDVGEDEAGPFLVMDYVEGISLSAFIRQHAERGERIPVPLCLFIVAQTARGLHAAHELLDPNGKALHLVHRDVSPQNILIAREGVVRVTDFGVAKALGRSTHTSTGLLKGKVGYMSPEQLRFEPIDRRCDLFALGVVLAELLTSTRMFPGKDAAAVARSVLGEPPPDLGDMRPEVPPSVVELAFELLAKDPKSRPESAAEVATRLEDVIALEGVVDLAGYVEGRFGDELDRRRAEVRDAATQQQASSVFDLAPVTTLVDAPVPRWRGWALGAAVVSVVSVFIGAWWWIRPTPQRSEPDSAAPAAATQTVEVVVESRPSGAEVRIEGRSLGVTPLTVPLPRGGEPVNLELGLDGYIDAAQSLHPTEDTRLLIALTPEPDLIVPDPEPAVAQPAPSPKKRKAKSRRRSSTRAEGEKPMFRRFD